MQLPFSEANTSEANTSEANTAPTNKPTLKTTNNSIAAPHNSSSFVVDRKASVEASADQPTVAALDKAEPIEVVKQTIDDLEAQGLLMLFDRHDQVAKRLTGDLIAAGVLQEERQSSQQEAYSDR